MTNAAGLLELGTKLEFTAALRETIHALCPGLDFEVSDEEGVMISEIVCNFMNIPRAVPISMEEAQQQAFFHLMDLTACHRNGCPLDLDAMRKGRDLDVVHDVLGINRHLNRRTGQLKDSFIPRFAATTN